MAKPHCIVANSNILVGELTKSYHVKVYHHFENFRSIFTAAKTVYSAGEYTFSLERNLTVQGQVNSPRATTRRRVYLNEMHMIQGACHQQAICHVIC